MSSQTSSMVVHMGSQNNGFAGQSPADQSSLRDWRLNNFLASQGGTPYESIASRNIQPQTIADKMGHEQSANLPQTQ